MEDAVIDAFGEIESGGGTVGEDSRLLEEGHFRAQASDIFVDLQEDLVILEVV